MPFTSTNTDPLIAVPDLINRLTGVKTGFNVVDGSSHFQGLTGGIGSVSLFDGINYGGAVLGPGILLTSGDGTPPETNTLPGFGLSNGLLGDTDLTNVIHSVFNPALNTQNATTLQFDINVTDPNQKFVAVDLVFGSDEFPEYSNSSFVDIAAFFVNGVNYANFGNDPTAPLSVLDKNLGNFQNNSGGQFAIEYDGVSTKLTIFAPVHFGVNTIKLGVADTGDAILDSGLFAANLRLSKTGVNGIVKTVEGDGGNNVLKGTGDLAEFFSAGAGNDKVFALGGNDILDLGAGKDTGDGGKGDDLLIGGAGKDLLKGGLGADVFQFLSVKDTSANHARSDVIQDFSHKQHDKIDLSAIDANTKKAGDQAFKFIGAQDFHHKAGELHYVAGTGNIFVEGDVNGDGRADFAIQVNKVASLGKSDFIL